MIAGRGTLEPSAREGRRAARDRAAVVSAAGSTTAKRGRIVRFAVASVEYRYELWRGDKVIATGRLQRIEQLEVGDRLEIGRVAGIVRAVEPVLGERELRLVVRLSGDN
jgi:hypothetical protein